MLFFFPCSYSVLYFYMYRDRRCPSRDQSFTMLSSQFEVEKGGTTRGYDRFHQNIKIMESLMLHDQRSPVLGQYVKAWPCPDSHFTQTGFASAMWLFIFLVCSSSVSVNPRSIVRIIAFASPFRSSQNFRFQRAADPKLETFAISLCARPAQFIHVVHPLRERFCRPSAVGEVVGENHV
jgi:hypothetical protein